MPYYKERANKFSHEKIINNKLLKNKLNNYKIVFDIDENNAGYKLIKKKFISRDNNSEYKDVDYIFTVDSSFMEIPVNEEIPTAKLGIINFGSSIINLKMKSNVYEGGFINPQKFNDIYNSSMLTFICPTFNVTLKDERDLNVLDCIRKEIYSFYYSNSPFSDVKLINTLFNIMKSNMDSFELKCTNRNCVMGDPGISTYSSKLFFELDNVGINPFYCPRCGNVMYLTDYLRLHEAADIEFGNNTILTRFAQVTEHVININVIDSLLKYRSYDLLSKTAFVVDGPLAIYGEPAKLNRSILKYLHFISKTISNEIIYFGILKTGKLKDHFNLLFKKFKEDGNEIYRDSFMLVDDDYRFQYIQKAPKQNIFFGQEVLFGQDYLFYSKDQKRFVISLMYPVESRDKHFGEKVFDYKNYKNLGTVLNLINNIAIDLYEDAVLPVTLAHKYAAISLNPGTNMLEIFMKENIG